MPTNATTVTRLPPPPPLSSRRFTPRQDEVLDGIQSIVLAEGFRHLRITHFAERLRCSNATLYQLSPSKDELLMLVIDRWYQNSGRAAWRRLQSLTDPVERVSCWLDAGIEGVRNVSTNFREDVESHAAIRQLVATQTRYYIEVLESMLDDGVRAGVFDTPSPHLAAQAMEAAVTRLEDPRVLREAGVTEVEGAEVLKQLLLHGVIPSRRRRA